MANRRPTGGIIVAFVIVGVGLGLLLAPSGTAPCHEYDHCTEVVPVPTSLPPPPDGPLKSNDGFSVGGGTLYVAASLKVEGAADSEGIVNALPGAKGGVVFTIFHSPQDPNSAKTEVVRILVDPSQGKITLAETGSPSLDLTPETQYPVGAYFRFTVSLNVTPGPVKLPYVFMVDEFSHQGDLGFKIASVGETGPIETGSIGGAVAVVAVLAAAAVLFVRSRRR